MNKLIFFAIVISFLYTSCINERRVSREQAIAYYDSINLQIKITRPPIQKFLDKMTETFNKLKTNADIFIDTNELMTLLYSAKKMEYIRFENIDKIKEVDTQIHYKQKVLKTETILQGFLKHECPKCIEIFVSKSTNRYNKSSSIILPKLKLLKQSLNTLEQTQIEFRNKYNFSIPQN